MHKLLFPAGEACIAPVRGANTVNPEMPRKNLTFIKINHMMKERCFSGGCCMSRKAVGIAVLVIGLWALIGAAAVIHRQVLTPAGLIALIFTLLLIAGGVVLLVQSKKKPQLSKIAVGGVLLGFGLFMAAGLAINVISPNDTQGPDVMIGLISVGLIAGGAALIVQGKANKKNNDTEGDTQ